MIEVTVKSIDGANIDGEFQLSILSAKTGQTISRTDISEQPNFDKIEYLEDYKINKSLNNYLFMKGKVKVCYEWDETNGIEQRDVDKIQEIYTANNLEDTHANKTITNNSFMYEIDYNGYVTEWKERSTNYELSSHKSSITSLQDDTVLICCLQEDYGYKFYNVDIPVSYTHLTLPTSDLV